MGPGATIRRVRSLLGEAFRGTRSRRAGDDSLRRHFAELGVLPQASELIAYRLAEVVLAEVERVGAHLCESDPQTFADREDWLQIGYAVSYVALMKAWRGLDAAFKDAKRQGAAARNTPEPHQIDAQPGEPLNLEGQSVSPHMSWFEERRAC